MTCHRCSASSRTEDTGIAYKAYFDKNVFQSYLQSKNCNLGYSLTAADVTGDGHEDLIIGSPHWSRGQDFPQNGFIAALSSEKSYGGKYFCVACEA